MGGIGYVCERVFLSPLEIRQAVAKIVKFTGEPKSADIRRQSQKAITGLFELNPTNFSLILRTLPKADQDNANKILSAYVSELPSSGDESDKDTPSAPRIKRAIPAKVCSVCGIKLFSCANSICADSAESRPFIPSSSYKNS